MSENNNQVSCMYREVPALQAVNQVAGFDPMRFLRRTVSRITGENVWKLDLRYMRAWFRMARPNGRVRFKPLRITERLAIFEAQVYLDRSDAEPVSNFTAQCTREEAAGGDYIQAAQDAALEVALSNAGFGIQFADLTYDGNGERYGSEAPVPTQAVKGNATPVAPVTMPYVNVKETVVPAGETVQSESQARMQPSVQQTAGTVSHNAVPAAGEKEMAQSRPVINIAGNKAADQPVRAAVKVMAAQPATSATEYKAASQPAAASVKTVDNLPVTPATVDKKASQPVAASVKAAESQPVSVPVKVAEGLPVAPTTADKTADRPPAAAVKVMTSLPVTSAAEGKAEGQPAPEDKAHPDNVANTSQNIVPANAQDAPRYTKDMPVEEIMKLMTLEEARNVVVETGVCKGWTMGEVAERRAPSLKFYVCVDTKTISNVVRAAAQIMWDHMSQKKAS